MKAFAYAKDTRKNLSYDGRAKELYDADPVGMRSASLMTKEELCAILEEGYRQAMTDDSFSIEEVFGEIESDFLCRRADILSA